jgi:DNA-binding NarL/FixJ family response regulator
MKLLLVDSASLFRAGLKLALIEVDGAGDMEVAGECSAGATAVQMAAALAPEVVVSDLYLDDHNAIALARDLKRVVPSVRLLVLASHGGEAIVHAALAAGAGGYALKTQQASEIVAAIRTVGCGELVLPPGIPEPTGKKAQTGKPPYAQGIDRLSHRERQIFDLVIWGSSNKQIAGRLGISVKTVETHRGHINGKLRVHTSADIVRLASLWGMLVPVTGIGPHPVPQSERHPRLTSEVVATAAQTVAR